MVEAVDRREDHQRPFGALQRMDRADGQIVRPQAFLLQGPLQNGDLGLEGRDDGGDVLQAVSALVGDQLGAAVFGFSMQIVMGCGSGTLVNAGSGNALGLVALPLFVVGSFLGTLHLDAWQALGSLPTISLSGTFGPSLATVLTLAALAGVAVLAVLRAKPGQRLPERRLVLAAMLLAGLAVLNLVIAGQPWGVVYGLGLWGAKVAQAGGMDVVATTFWSAPANVERLEASLLTDVTSLTNIGIIAGALIAARWRRPVGPQIAPLPLRAWMVAALAAIAMGYSSRLAFGCNVGAFYSGISTGSLHGWAWFPAAFAGALLALRLRPWLGLEKREPAPLRQPAGAS
jgi:uncharacterized membrane protein YedE/YeeE